MISPGQELSAIRNQLKNISQEKNAGSDEADGVIDAGNLVRELLAISEELLQKEEALKNAGEILNDANILNSILSALVDTMPIGIIIADAAGEIMLTNAVSQEILGGSVSGSVTNPKRNYQTFYPNGEPFPATEMPLQKAVFEGKSNKNVEICLRLDDKTEKFILSSASPVMGSDGNISAGVVVFQDISAIKAAQTAQSELMHALIAERTDRIDLANRLQNERDLLNTIMETTDAQIAYLDHEFNFVRVNEAYCRGSGYTKEELIGKNHFSIFPSNENKKVFKEVVENKEPAFIQSRAFEFPDRPELGTTYWDWSLIPMINDEGMVDGLVFSLVDRTEYVRTKFQLDEEHSRLMTILENLPTGILVFDDRNDSIQINPVGNAILNGSSKPGNEIFHIESEFSQAIFKKTSTLVDSIRKGRALRNIQVEIRNRKHQKRTLLVDAAPLTNQHGKIDGGVGVFEDISERLALEKAVQEANRNLTMLNKMGRDLTTSLQLQDVVDALVTAAQNLVATSGCSVWLVDESHPAWLICKASSEPGGVSLAGKKINKSESVIGWVALRGESVIVKNTFDEARFSPIFEQDLKTPVISLLVIPLKLKSKILGVLNLSSEDYDHFDDQDRIVMETLASTAVIAIQNAYYYQHAQEEAVSTERAHLARELHDAVSQTLFSTSVIAESLPRLWEKSPERIPTALAQLHVLTRGALAEMRSLLLELRPQSMADMQLPELIRQLVESFQARKKIAIHYEQMGCGKLPENVQIAIYRIAQEALNNIMKHAQADRIDVSLRCEDFYADLVIRDNGQGYNATMIAPGSMGIDIMRERAEKNDIELIIDTQIGYGTEIEAIWKKT